ncbi:hypothetical protein Leryth_025884 [Lithospermum erythrorhizon]|nr:hypothetical protein Leryth_025884 [Lithospermum erythrorhizon]
MLTRRKIVVQRTVTNNKTEQLCQLDEVQQRPLSDVAKLQGDTNGSISERSFGLDKFCAILWQSAKKKRVHSEQRIVQAQGC